MKTRMRNVILFVMLMNLITVNLVFGDLPVVPGFIVEVYAELQRPNTLCFAPDGVMYVGNGSNSPIVNSVYRIEVGGGPDSVSSYGQSLYDPDAIGYDRDGLISGTPGAVLTGGWSSPPHFTAILPDGSLKKLWEGPFTNPHDIAFDSTGRMLLLDPTSRGVYESLGGEITELFKCPMQDCCSIAVDLDDNIFISMGHYSEGMIRAYHTDGTPYEDIVLQSFTTRGPPPIAFGKGGVWGYSLYVITDNVFMRFDSPLDSPGIYTIIGTGFNGIECGDMEFGPDGALYVLDFVGNKILRIAPPNPLELVQDLVDLVIQVNLENGISNSNLEAKLNAALNTLDDINNNNDVAAINTLVNFINAVIKQRDRGEIPSESAQELIDAAQYIIDLLTNG